MMVTDVDGEHKILIEGKRTNGARVPEAVERPFSASDPSANAGIVHFRRL